jgi:hypothetical protein
MIGGDRDTDDIIPPSSIKSSKKVMKSKMKEDWNYLKEK